MSMFSNLLSWAVSAAQTSAKAQALKQMQLLSTQLIEHIHKEAPGVAVLAEQQITAGITTFVAGVQSKIK